MYPYIWSPTAVSYTHLLRILEGGRRNGWIRDLLQIVAVEFHSALRDTDLNIAVRIGFHAEKRVGSRGSHQFYAASGIKTGMTEMAVDQDFIEDEVEFTGVFDREIQSNQPSAVGSKTVLDIRIVSQKLILSRHFFMRNTIAVSYTHLTAKSPDEIRREIQMHGGVLTCIDGMKITVEEKTRMNMIMLGALCKASGFLPFECLEEIIRETIGRKYPAMLDSNLRGLRRGFEEGTTKAFPNDETYPYVPFTEERRSLGRSLIHI